MNKIVIIFIGKPGTIYNIGSVSISFGKFNNTECCVGMYRDENFFNRLEV